MVWEVMPVSKATPGPWVTGSDLENCGGGFNIQADTKGESVRIAHTSRVVYGGEELVSEPEAQANAVLIVAAVNAHDDLVAALKQTHEALDTLLAELDGQSGTYGCSRDAGYEALKLAKAAMEKAEGKG